MNAHDQAKAQNEQRYSSEAVRRLAALAALMKLTCAVNGLRLREDRLTVSSPPMQPVELELIGREPFGFAFMDGHQAIFNVPSGHRFVIEHMNISCWAENHPHLFVQLVTKSPHMFRNLTLCTSPQALTGSDRYLDTPGTPIQIQGLTTNKFLFSDSERKNSSTVPPDTYVQVWGYLEPSSFPDSF